MLPSHVAVKKKATARCPGHPSTNTYAWDAESQLKSAAGVNYLYGGDGRRVGKVGSKLYWYGSGGEILAETDPSGNTTAEYVFFGGKRIAMLPASGSPLYYVEDMLGTSRVITQSNGVVCYDADFYPYGGEIPSTNTCPQNYKFEGWVSGFVLTNPEIKKERDSETGNDDFGARYYSWRFGRWLSADWSSVPAPVPYANLSNPQTLNLYAMVADDPESFADLDGHAGGCDTHGECGGTGWIAGWSFFNSIWASHSNENEQTSSHPQQKNNKKINVQKLKKQLRRKIKAYIKAHPKTVKNAIIALQIVTILSALADDGASLGALPEEEGLASAAEAAAEEATSTIGNANKLEHIFGDVGHNLEGLVSEFGSREAAGNAIQQATESAVRQQSLTGVFETTVKVGSQSITVRGKVIDGVVKIGTAFQ